MEYNLVYQVNNLADLATVWKVICWSSPIFTLLVSLDPKEFLPEVFLDRMVSFVFRIVTYEAFKLISLIIVKSYQ